ncbi:hypothetical protein F7734_34790 [Scytonema sp. UIC 10036]|uniref:hypothetical protein n=1 Tax=Scytonema sp. UIC 10036 TaxID=2304196 RepID=UPI0012DADD13|nr:hypothetical protein [Scytonema sp. UIC 10036]MUG97224.1 hypothetical protein [Scytonema sp. UIC 10036]
MRTRNQMDLYRRSSMTKSDLIPCKPFLLRHVSQKKASPGIKSLLVIDDRRYKAIWLRVRKADETN